MAGFPPSMQPTDPFMHLIDEYGIRFSKLKHMVVEYWDRGGFRIIKFAEYDQAKGQRILEMKVQNTYEDIRKQLAS